MDVQIEDISPLEKKLSITIAAETVTDEVTQAYAKLKKKTQVPGFRKGRVPRKILERHYHDKVSSDIASRLVSDALAEVLQEQKLKPVGAPDVAPGEVAAEKPFTFTAIVTLAPVVDASDYEGIPLTHKKATTTDEELDGHLKEMAEQTSLSVDDELAKRMGHETLDELKEALREQLNEMKDQRTRSQLDRTIAEILVDRNPFDVPDKMVQVRAQTLVQNLAAHMMDGMSQSMNPTLEDLEEDKRENVLEEAEFSVRRELLLAAIARQEQIVVRPGQREALIEKLAKQTGQPGDVLKEMLSQDTAGAKLDEKILDDNVIDWLFERAVIEKE